LTIWWDKPFEPKHNYKKGGVPYEYAVFLDQEHIQVLRMCDTNFISIRHKKNGIEQRRGEIFQIPKREWKIPKCYNDWVKEKHETPEHFLARMFLDTANAFEHVNYSMVRVAVHNDKDDLTAQFSIDPRRMSYFFQDRDIVYTPGGAREACFHVVKAHERVTKHGSTFVKFHFRGAKEFTWAGYRVTVTVPQRDHVPLSEFTVGVDDAYWLTRAEIKNGITEPEMAEMLRRHIEGETLRSALEERRRENNAQDRIARGSRH
jgi:hypothetical protein